MSVPVFILIILLGMVGSAFFSGAEIAIISCNRLRMHNLASEGNRAARIVERFLHQRRQVVTTTLLGTNLCNVGAASAAAGLFTTLIPGGGALISIAVIAPLLLVFGEIFPKTLFRQNADGVCLRIAPVLRIVHHIVSPLVWLADATTGLLLRAFGPGRATEGEVTREEILLLLSEGVRQGAVRLDGGRMIHGAFRLSETRVKSVTVPLVNVFALDEDTPIADALALIAERGHSRVPVYRDRVDNIVGLLYVFDLLDVPEETTVGELMHPAYYVPETKGLQELLLEMKQSRTHLAIVVDEFGGASGIVTLEDALERIVGTIRDEFDRTPDLIARGGEEWSILDAGTSLQDAWRHAGIELPEGDYETIAGYLTSILGRIPEAGELISSGGWEFEVLDATRQRVARVRVRKSGKSSPGQA